MSEQQSRNVVRSVLLAVLVVVPVSGFLYWFFTCPCDTIPGGYLLGAETEAPIEDWSFANDISLCQVQINAGVLPHSINLNCMSTTTGNLYLSCSQCGSKRWSNAVLNDGTARLRLNATVYPVNLTRVLDPGELDQAWNARVTKLNTISVPASAPPPPDAPRPDGWWSFRVESR
jgi:hypothetical protein